MQNLFYFAANKPTMPALEQIYTDRYRKLLQQAEIECPSPETARNPVQRGRVKRSKSRNLLERLRDFEQEALRFMINPIVPFTNNQSENDTLMRLCCINNVNIMILLKIYKCRHKNKAN